MLFASLFSVSFLISSIVNDSIYWEWMYYAGLYHRSFRGVVFIAHVYIPILLTIISLAIPLFMSISKKSKIRHRLLIVFGIIFILVSIFVNLVAEVYNISICVFALYCLITSAISLRYRKSIIAESIYGHSKEYKDILAMKKKKDDYDKTLRRNKRKKEKAIKVNQEYTKAISDMKKEIK